VFKKELPRDFRLQVFFHESSLGPVGTNFEFFRIDENLEQGFIIGVNDTGDHLSSITTTPAIIYKPVSLTPAINTKLRISPRIFVKIRNGPNRIVWGQGETDS
jgi:hypothetical protein